MGHSQHASPFSASPQPSPKERGKSLPLGGDLEEALPFFPSLVTFCTNRVKLRWLQGDSTVTLSSPSRHLASC